MSDFDPTRHLDTTRWPVPFELEAPIHVPGRGMLVAYDAAGQVLASDDEQGIRRFELPLMMEALIGRPGQPGLVQLRIGIKRAGPVCLRLTVVGSAEEPVTSTSARIPLRELMDEAVMLVGGWDRSTMRPEPDAFKVALEETFTRPRPGERLTDEQLKQAADVYRYALSLGLKPTASVAEAFNVSRSTAGRWIVETRRRGLLGPAIAGRAGEQEVPPRSTRRRARRKGAKDG